MMELIKTFDEFIYYFSSSFIKPFSCRKRVFRHKKTTTIKFVMFVTNHKNSKSIFRLKEIVVTIIAHHILFKPIKMMPPKTSFFLTDCRMNCTETAKKKPLLNL